MFGWKGITLFAIIGVILVVLAVLVVAAALASRSKPTPKSGQGTPKTDNPYHKLYK